MPVIPLDPKNVNQVSQVAQLHSTLLPDSPVAIFGKTFMQRFYYSKLIYDDFFQCFCYHYNSEIVGFITVTTDPVNFLAKGFMRNFFNLCLTMPMVMLKKPSRIMKIIKVAQLTSSFEESEGDYGAILSFGVLEPYRNLKFLRKTGLRISHDLFDTAVNFFKEAGLSSIELLVEPSNKETLLFYHMMRCRFENICKLGKSWTKVICSI